MMTSAFLDITKTSVFLHIRSWITLSTPGHWPVSHHHPDVTDVTEAQLRIGSGRPSNCQSSSHNSPPAALPSFRQPAGLPRVERLEVTDVTGFTIPEINT